MACADGRRRLQAAESNRRAFTTAGLPGQLLYSRVLHLDGMKDLNASGLKKDGVDF